MKRLTVAIIAAIMMLGTEGFCVSATAPDAYMEISVTGNWHIFSKDMDNDELLDAVGMSTAEVNSMLKDTGSESVIINSETGAQVYVKVLKNDKSYELWNIQDTDNAYLMENIDTLLSDGFNISELDYSSENVVIQDCAYMKQITVHGSTFYDGAGHGIVASGTFVNGYGIVFMMKTQETAPTEEEIAQVSELCSGISFTVIKDKSDSEIPADSQQANGVFGYILSGFGALVIIIFCVYMIERLRHKDEDTEEVKVEIEK